MARWRASVVAGPRSGLTMFRLNAMPSKPLRAVETTAVTGPSDGSGCAPPDGAFTSVQVSVRDRGLGIDADDLPHVFEPFYRGRRAVASQVRGSGLGLSVVQGIARAHGGDVRVAARAGGGTEVVLTLPAADAPVETA